LVQEILVVAEPNGANRVEIQFNSTTLEGLRVQISQDQDQIAIRFSAASALTSNLLSRNLDQLSAALHSKGLQVSPIQVELAPPRIEAAPGSSGSRDGRHEQSEERRQQRQQQR
jgi:flagellar hook-length control protein FliK